MSGQANHSNNPMFMTLELGTGELSERLLPYLNPLDLQNLRASAEFTRETTEEYLSRRLGQPNTEKAIKNWKKENAQRTRTRIQYSSLWISVALSIGVLIWDFVCLQKLMYGSALLDTPRDVRAMSIGVPGVLLMLKMGWNLIQLGRAIKNTRDVRPTKLSQHLPPISLNPAIEMALAQFGYQPHSIGGLKAASSEESQAIIQNWQDENRKLKDWVGVGVLLTTVNAICLTTLPLSLLFAFDPIVPLMSFFISALCIFTFSCMPFLLDCRYAFLTTANAHFELARLSCNQRSYSDGRTTAGILTLLKSPWPLFARQAKPRACDLFSNARLGLIFPWH